MVRLSDEQREALSQRQGNPVRVTDPTTQRGYVLLSEDDYRRVRALLEEDPFDVNEALPLSNEVAATEGWDDPAMDRYNALDPRRPS